MGKASVAQEVDHIVPLEDVETNDPDNLQAICVACHVRKTTKCPMGCDVNGRPLDPNHPWNNGRVA
jgi:5-methylcytosine-specific restriction protein A